MADQLDLLAPRSHGPASLGNARSWAKAHRRNADTWRRLGRPEAAAAYDAEADKAEARAQRLLTEVA